jgi:hypothetical protein
MPLRVVCPADFIEERKYILGVLLADLLGISFRLEIDPVESAWRLVTDSGAVLLFSDAFFAQGKAGNGTESPDILYRKERIPQAVRWLKTDLAPEGDLPVIFGGDDPVVRTENTWHCSLDIFASAFFMLTRWEENFIVDRDIHGRVAAHSVLAHRSGFLGRPIVNEYAGFLENLLNRAGTHVRPGGRYEIIPTHDVDYVGGYSPRSIAAELLKRRAPARAGRKLLSRLRGEQVFDTFDWLMERSEMAGLKSHFNFMAGGATRFDGRPYIDSSRVAQLLETIRRRGHIVGFHPSYLTCDDAGRWRSEKEKLEHVFGETVREGRQHVLRMNLPGTFRIWEEEQMLVDSSMGYADHDGFRCGTGDDFPVFDFSARRQLRLKERPLVVMDGSLWQYRKLSVEESFGVLDSYRRKAAHYHMKLTILFHSHSFDAIDWPGWKSLYEELLS